MQCCCYFPHSKSRY